MPKGETRTQLSDEDPLGIDGLAMKLEGWIEDQGWDLYTAVAAIQLDVEPAVVTPMQKQAVKNFLYPILFGTNKYTELWRI